MSNIDLLNQEVHKMNFAKLWGAIVAFGKTIENDLKPLADKIKPMIKATEEEIATVALNAVAAEAPKVLSGQEKLSNATSNVITTLASQGKSIGATAAQAAVQVSYNFLSNLLHPQQ